MKAENYLTTPQAAEQLGVSVRRIEALIKAGQLRSHQRGKDCVINQADLARLTGRKPGGPVKVDESQVPEETPITRAEMKAGDVVKTPPAAEQRRRAKRAGK
jgi:excisionase family DNA binding protein